MSVETKQEAPSHSFERLVRQYKDVSGNPCSLEWLVRNEPEWAANQIRHRDALEKEKTEWKAIADKLAHALDGCRKRYVLTLGEITGDPDPSFDPPAPSAIDNINAVTLALAEYDMASKPNAELRNPQP